LFAHAQLIHDGATAPREPELTALLGYRPLLKVATDLWPVFKWPRVAAFGWPPRGIRTHAELIAHSAPELLSKKLYALDQPVSPQAIVEWQHHARAYKERRPIVFGSERFDHEDFIALDLEYIPGTGHVWLFGMQLEYRGRSETFQTWCDTPTDVSTGLKELMELLNAHRKLPVLTWAGTGADLPELDRAARVAKRRRSRALRSRHVDLYDYVRRTMRFPVPSMGLKELAYYVKAPRRTSSVSDGQHALMIFQSYQESNNPGHRQLMRDNLLAYNRDDLQSLVHVARHVRLVVSAWSGG
jgi:predicted RecB family nuclease